MTGMGEHDNGCWNCGNLEGRVLTTGKDEDGNSIRLRCCTKCGDRWVTEERRIARSVGFFQRAFSQAEAQRRRRAQHTRTCRFCKARYTLGQWPNHVKYNPKHLSWKAQRAKEIHRYKVEDARWRYHADPVYRANQIESATRRRRKRRAAARDKAA